MKKKKHVVSDKDIHMCYISHNVVDFLQNIEKRNIPKSPHSIGVVVVYGIGKFISNKVQLSLEWIWQNPTKKIQKKKNNKQSWEFLF